MFFKNLLLALGILLGMLIFLLLYLRIYTLHNRAIAVPDFSDLPVEDAARYIEKRKLTYEIFDSIFVSEKDPGVVIDQHPKAGALVKKGRKVYLTINANSPEKMPMPDLVGITLREARTKITVAGLKLGKLRYRYDMAKNVVLEQEYGGEIIEPGDTILKGTAIDLVLGKGLSNERTRVPDLIGMSYEEAQNRAADAFFTTSSPIEDMSIVDKDTLVPFVYKQNPAHGEKNLYPLGTQIIVWVTLDSTKLPGFAEEDSLDIQNPEIREINEGDEYEENPDDYDYSI